MMKMMMMKTTTTILVYICPSACTHGIGTAGPARTNVSSHLCNRYVSQRSQRTTEVMCATPFLPRRCALLSLATVPVWRLPEAHPLGWTVSASTIKIAFTSRALFARCPTALFPSFLHPISPPYRTMLSFGGGRPFRWPPRTIDCPPPFARAHARGWLVPRLDGVVPFSLHVSYKGLSYVRLLVLAVCLVLETERGLCNKRENGPKQFTSVNSTESRPWSFSKNERWGRESGNLLLPPPRNRPPCRVRVYTDQR